MRLLSLLFLIFHSLTIFCQNFGDTYTSGWETIEGVKKDLNKKLKEAKKERTINSTTEKKNDTLVFSLQDPYDGFVIKTTFNLKHPDFEESYCDFQQIEFDCTPCGKKHLEEIIKINKFRQKSENVYLSSFLIQTEMTIKYNSGNKDCLVVTYRYVDLPRKEYKKLYRSLKKKTTA